MTLDVDGGESIASITQDYPTSVEASEDLTWPRYTFDGWYANAGNTHFTSADGILYSYDIKMLVKYLDGRTATTYEIPASIETI